MAPSGRAATPIGRHPRVAQVVAAIAGSVVLLAGLPGPAAHGAAAVPMAAHRLPQALPPDARATASGTSDCQATVVVGRSRKGTRIVACQVAGSDPGAGRSLLVVGSMHGDEQAGIRITKRLRARDVRGLGVDLWVIPTINPDGTRAGTRGNGRRVDLNGNFPTRNWKVRMPGTILWGGPRAASEPETRALMKAMRTIRPAQVVVFHQHANVIDCPPYRSRALTERLNELTGYRIRCMPVLTGNFTAWANRKYDWTSAVTFELERRPSAARLNRVADGLVTLVSEQSG